MSRIFYLDLFGFLRYLGRSFTEIISPKGSGSVGLASQKDIYLPEIMNISKSPSSKIRRGSPRKNLFRKSINLKPKVDSRIILPDMEILEEEEERFDKDAGDKGIRASQKKTWRSFAEWKLLKKRP
jgi:hypothetical protein